MPKLIIEVGAPGSGKSTCARERCETNSNCIRVNRDDIRTMGFGVSRWNPQREEWVKKVEKQSIVAALECGYDAIVDSTNLLVSRRDADWQWVKEAGHEIEICDHTDVPLEELIRRDSHRSGVARVGRVVIERLLAQAGMLPVQHVRPVVICTYESIADMNHRMEWIEKDRSFFYSELWIDGIKEEFYKLVRQLGQDNDIWIVSDHPDFYVDEMGEVVRVGDLMAAWLGYNHVPFQHLFMRRAIDTKSVVETKEEIFKTLILKNIPTGNISIVVDTDQASVGMWNRYNLMPLTGIKKVDTAS